MKQHNPQDIGFRFIGRGTRAELEQQLERGEISPRGGKVGDWPAVRAAT